MREVDSENALFVLLEHDGQYFLDVDTQGHATATLRYPLDAHELACYQKEGRSFILNLAQDIGWSPAQYQSRFVSRY
jgi:hypothetical protein